MELQEALEPLLQFATMLDDAAVADFTQSVQKFQLAWVYSRPERSGAIMSFLTEFVKQCLKARAAGMSWKSIGVYWTAVIRRVEQRSSSGMATTDVPDPLWCKSNVYTWVPTASAGRRRCLRPGRTRP